MLHQNRETYKGKLQSHINNIMTTDDINQVASDITGAMRKVAKEVAERKPRKTNKISCETKLKIEERRTLYKNGLYATEQYQKVRREARKMIRKDREENYRIMAEKVIEENKNLKCLRKKQGKQQIIALKDGNNVETRNRDKIKEIAHKFYQDLYSPRTERPPGNQNKRKVVNVGSEEIPEINEEEIIHAINSMKKNKAPGGDDIIAEMLKEAQEIVIPQLKHLFNLCIEQQTIPTNWNEAIIVIVFKKGDRTMLENYRPISLLSQMYKLFTRIITNRITNKLDAYQPVEQAAFRKGYSTNDHLLTVKIIIEKSIEYNFPIHMAFVDYEKAFDSVEHWAIFEELDKARIDHRYKNLLKNIYQRANAKIRLHEETDNIEIKRGIRQGDTISPKLFTLALEGIFKKLEWGNMGLNISGAKISHLRFADDIVLFADNTMDLERMLYELDRESSKIGLKMNKTKTKIMSQDQVQIAVNGHILENVQEYIYLGQQIEIGKGNKEIEIERRRRLGWAAFGKLSHILKDRRIPQYLRTRIYEQCVVPVITYGAQTWTLTKTMVNKLRTTQRAMERVMIGVTLRDRKRNEWIRQRTKVVDIVERVTSLKWNFAGHIVRLTDERWNSRIIRWRPWEEKRGRGRPIMRWYDDIKRVAGFGWTRTAQNREKWRRGREAYAQYWAQ